MGRAQEQCLHSRGPGITKQYLHLRQEPRLNGFATDNESKNADREDQNRRDGEHGIEGQRRPHGRGIVLNPGECRLPNDVFAAPQAGKSAKPGAHGSGMLFFDKSILCVACAGTGFYFSAKTQSALFAHHRAWSVCYRTRDASLVRNTSKPILAQHHTLKSCVGQRTDAKCSES
jgi:hypothetical protein